jgi:hypothetical protein
LVSLVAAREAHAEQSDFRVFGEAAKADKSVAIAEVVKRCTFNEMSREGPRPKDVAKCDAAATALDRQGVAAAPAIFAALDDERTPYAARQRLIAVLGRTADTSLVPPMLDAMARITTRKLQTRMPEFEMLHEAVRDLTRQAIGELPPWEKAPAMSNQGMQTDRVVDWKLWLDKNRARSHDELSDEATADARAHANDKDMAKRYQAVRYLLRYEPSEGAKAARALREVEALPEEGQRDLDWAIEEADRQAKIAKPAHAKKKSTKAKTKAKHAKPAPPKDVGA